MAAPRDHLPNGLHLETTDCMAGKADGMGGKARNSKVFNDSIHGSIELPELCFKIMNTLEFQRLKYVKQLGAVYFLYPAASHNRFEHSLGVAFLAGEFAEHLRRKQHEQGITDKDEQRITDEDVLCVQVAGLCHDLGHGPLSHLWQEFMERKKPKQKWKHEKCSAEMLDHLLSENGIDVTKYGLNGRDVTFIKELFLPTEEDVTAASWPHKGRTREKAFLYQIVANSQNNIDVDKFDYFLRDCHNLGVSVTFNYERLMQHSRVITTPDKGLPTICWRDKEVDNVSELFRNRYQLHKKAYQHRICQVINEMVLDVFKKADKHLKYRGKDGELYTLSTVFSDMVAYSKLTDDVLMQVLCLEGEDKEVEEAKAIVRKLFSRELYQPVGKTALMSGGGEKTEELKKEIEDELKTLIDKNNNNTDEVTLYQKALDSVIVYDTKLNFGNKGHNPLDKIWFYSKAEPSKVFRINGDEKSTMRPYRFQDVIVMVCSRSDDQKVIKFLREKFSEAYEKLKLKWTEENRSPSHQ